MKAARTISQSERDQAKRMLRHLKVEGRTQTWLAEATGFSRSYVNKVLHGALPPSPAFLSKYQEAIGQQAVVGERYRGRSVVIPASIVRRLPDEHTFTLGEIQSTYDRAWKDSWIREHGPEVLEEAASAAYILAQKIRDGGRA